MSLLSTVKNLFKPAPAPTIRLGFLAGQRARTTVDTSSESRFTQYLFVSSPADPLDTWRVEDLNDKTLARITVSRLIELLADVSPEISKALWDFLLFCNPGYEAAAFRPGAEEQDDQATAALLAMIDRLDQAQANSFDIIIGKLFLGIFARGALFTEAVFDDVGRELLDLATPDPGSARFREVTDPARGKYWQLGQWQGGEFVTLDSEMVRYLPVHPWPGKPPYGRAPLMPAVFSALFLIGLLHDLRRVIAQQGYPRLDVEIDLEQLRDAMPVDLASEPDKWKDWINDMIAEVKTVYASLEPDDAYIHTSAVTVNRPVGAVDADSLGAIDPIITALERMVTRALKSTRLMMGGDEMGSETFANREWEIYTAGIKSIQHLVETALEQLFGLALEAQGIQADVIFRFAELRASERLRDAQAEAMEIANEVSKYEAGWISQDEASETITGSSADAPGPRRQAQAPPPVIQDDGDGQEADSEAAAGRVGFTNVNIHCPDCGFVMKWDEEDKFKILCSNPGCKQFKIKYHQPVLPLKPVGANGR